jgi:hypothetical protein
MSIIQDEARMADAGRMLAARIAKERKRPTEVAAINVKRTKAVATKKRACT